MNDPCEAMMQYFEYKHLPPVLRNTSESVHDLAHEMLKTVTPGPEKTAGMRKLLEAKDCFVRANLAKQTKQEQD